MLLSHAAARAEHSPSVGVFPTLPFQGSVVTSENFAMLTLSSSPWISCRLPKLHVRVTFPIFTLTHKIYCFKARNLFSNIQIIQ